MVTIKDLSCKTCNILAYKRTLTDTCTKILETWLGLVSNDLKDLRFGMRLGQKYLRLDLKLSWMIYRTYDWLEICFKTWLGLVSDDFYRTCALWFSRILKTLLEYFSHINYRTCNIVEICLFVSNDSKKLTLDLDFRLAPIYFDSDLPKSLRVLNSL